MESILLVSSGSLTVPSGTPSNLLPRRPSPSSSQLLLPGDKVGTSGVRRRRFLISAFRSSSDAGDSRMLPRNSVEKMVMKGFASVSGSNQTSAVGTPATPVTPPPSYVGSPLFWIGVGVGFSALFSWVANYLKKYAMQQAFKAMMGPMAQEKDSFGRSAMFPGSAYSPPTSASSTIAPPPPPPQDASQPIATVDTPNSKVESVTPSTDTKEDTDSAEERKGYSFVDISPEDVTHASSTEGFSYSNKDLPPNGSTSMQDKGETSQQSDSRKPSGISLEALEKMMEDPTVQKMVYPYLPEEMRNPSTFKWMLQNPQYREQLQGMLNNMQGSKEWDEQMQSSLKNFDLNSAEVKQQFDQIGLTPEQVISKIMANPDVAMSFQNPKVQAAIMDCSQDPMNIRKYQGDKEVMDVFNKISELFPGAGL